MRSNGSHCVPVADDHRSFAAVVILGYVDGDFACFVKQLDLVEKSIAGEANRPVAVGVTDEYFSAFDLIEGAVVLCGQRWYDDGADADSYQHDERTERGISDFLFVVHNFCLHSILLPNLTLFRRRKGENSVYLR